jgi:hypothetical protein
MSSANALLFIVILIIFLVLIVCTFIFLDAITEASGGYKAHDRIEHILWGADIKYKLRYPAYYN